MDMIAEIRRRLLASNAVIGAIARDKVSRPTVRKTSRTHREPVY
jgi:hypothetical protein